MYNSPQLENTMSGLLYSVKYTTPTGKDYEVNIWENPYGSEFAVSVYHVTKVLFFTNKERVSYIEYQNRKDAFDSVEKIAISKLITEK